MAVRHRVDPVRMGEEIFYRIFHHIFHDEGARKHFEFSQINFFNNVQGLPGWNLWLKENTMVFQLVLLDAWEVINENGFNHLTLPEKTLVEGRFLIRYFPESEDPALDDFSCAEIIARLGPLFDHTGTPTLAGQKQLNENYFTVGYLDFRAFTDRDFVELKCIAPNQWKDIRIDGICLKNSEDEEFQMIEPGGIDRCVPGWDLAFFLFDKLITGFCYTYKTEPCAAIFAKKNGSRFEFDKNNQWKEKTDHNIELLHLSTGFEITPWGRASTCTCNGKGGSNTDNFIKNATYRMKKQGLQISDMWSRPGKPQHPVMKYAWLNARHLKFTSDTKTQMQLCCYHDH